MPAIQVACARASDAVARAIRRAFAALGLIAPAPTGRTYPPWAWAWASGVCNGGCSGRTRATGRAASISDSGTKRNPRWRSSLITDGSASAVRQPRPLMWKTMIDPGRVFFSTVRRMLAGVDPALGSPETTSQSTGGSPLRDRTCSTSVLNSPKGGRNAMLCLPKRASAASVSSIWFAISGGVSSGMWGWS